MNRLLAALPLLLATSLPLSAATVEVEVLLFARTQTADSVAEAWPGRQQINSFDGDLRPLGRYPWSPCPLVGDNCRPAQAPEQSMVVHSSDTIVALNNGLQLLATDQLQLTDARKQLSRHGDYRVLVHAGWQQPVANVRTAAPRILLQGGRNYGLQFATDGYARAPAAPTTPPAGDLQAEAAAELGQLGVSRGPAPIWEIEGVISLYNNGSLLAESELQWRQPGELPRRQGDSLLASGQPRKVETQSLVRDGAVEIGAYSDDQISAGSLQTTTEPFLFAYRNKQLQTITPGHNYYLDHPLFGLILQVRPTAKP